MCTRYYSAFVFVLASAIQIGPGAILAQTGSIHEPVRYVGGPVVHNPAHDGQLRPAIGIETVQVMRANRTHPEWADDFGWTYNHGPNIVYWNDRFYVEYLSNPVGEHIAPGQTLLSSSADGRQWEKPQVVFPVYDLSPPDPPGTTAMMHQRMGFYVAPDDRLLVLAFYGRAPNRFAKGGIGRVVREAYKDGTFGPIYFLRYNTSSGWSEDNTHFPFYKRSTDAGFVAACDALLADVLMRRQWFDEEHLDDDAFSDRNLVKPQAFNWYRRKDGRLVGLWKWSLAALSSDEGQTWSAPAKVATLQMTGAKISGRRTSDGRYALIYNPNVDDDHRWPLAIVTSDDGILFDDMLCVHGEVPPRRFAGRYKDFGPQYNRCVAEGNGESPGDDLWVTYSVNKEDIWVSRIPVPIRARETEPVYDNFDNLKVDGPVTNWNTYSPRWASVRVAGDPNVANKSLELADKDPYDYARAIRVFPETRLAKIRFKLRAEQNDFGRLEIDVTDRFGYRPVRFFLDADRQMKAINGRKVETIVSYALNRWYEFEVRVDVDKGNFTISLDGERVLSAEAFAEHATSVERISFRTGAYRTGPTLRNATSEQPDRTAPDPDRPESLAAFRLDDVVIAANTK
ncbi:MAG: exo-alpha-sialidase [Planctomycetales bacterium]|nr:exo-alpha-sialidase [Planctomycetales bacterium]